MDVDQGLPASGPWNLFKIKRKEPPKVPQQSFSGGLSNLLKREHKKSPEPPQQSVSYGRPVDIATWPPDSQTELSDGILDGRQSFLSGQEGI